MDNFTLESRLNEPWIFSIRSVTPILNIFYIFLKRKLCVKKEKRINICVIRAEREREIFDFRESNLNDNAIFQLLHNVNFH